MIQQTKLHPYQYLLAQSVHQHGRWNANQRVKDWGSNPVIMDALNEGFYAAFKYVEPANKRTFIALDVSGSMGYQSPGLDLTSAQVAAAMAMTIARTEPYYQIMGFANVLRDLEISPTMNLNNIMEKTSRMSFGSTDCALPMVHAQQRKLAIDTFVVITDNETWFGSVHPHVALRNYRQAMGIDAKLIVVGVVPTPFTIADPTDRGMLDVVGGDANLPKLITEFSAGQI
jgi:60 kDa SS-A/Ro ribonucleoprotein